MICNHFGGYLANILLGLINEKLKKLKIFEHFQNMMRLTL